MSEKCTSLDFTLCIYISISETWLCYPTFRPLVSSPIPLGALHLWCFRAAASGLKPPRTHSKFAWWTRMLALDVCFSQPSSRALLATRFPNINHVWIITKQVLRCHKNGFNGMPVGLDSTKNPRVFELEHYQTLHQLPTYTQICRSLLSLQPLLQTSRTGWRRCTGCRNLHISFHKRATKYRTPAYAERDL